MAETKLRNLFVCVPESNNALDRRAYAYNIWQERYSDQYNLISFDDTDESKRLDFLINNLIKIKNADLVVMGKNWDEYASCILIKRICDVYGIPMDFYETSDTSYEVINTIADRGGTNTLGDLITDLCKVPHNHEVGFINENQDEIDPENIEIRIDYEDGRTEIGNKKKSNNNDSVTGLFDYDYM